MSAVAPYAGTGTEFDPHDPNLLAEPLRSAVVELLATGRVTLTSGRRSTARQFQLRGQNGCAGREMDRSCKGSPTTAIPGTSRHEKGEAADLGGDLAYVRSQAGRLRIHAPVPGEPWHWEAIGPSTSAAPGGGAGSQPAAGWNPLDWIPGGGSVAAGLDAWSILTDGHTWFRVALVLGGAGMIVLGVLQLSGGLNAAVGLAGGGKVQAVAKLAEVAA